VNGQRAKKTKTEVRT
jgi:integrase